MTQRIALVANAGDGTISTFLLAEAGLGSTLEPLATTAVGPKCSTFAVDAKADRIYVGAGDGEPAIVTMALDRATGELRETHRTAIEARLTYLALTPCGRWLLGASYGGNVGHVWPVTDGAIGEATATVEFEKLHCVVTDGRFAYFVSLGDDLVAQYALGDGRLTPLEPPTVAFPAGSGPRHLVLNAAGEQAYLITEYSGEVFRLDRDTTTGALRLGESVSIVDPDANLTHSRKGADPIAEHLIWGADVHLSPDERWLLATERTESTLTSVALDDGRLGQRADLVLTEKQPRGFAVSPGGLVIVTGERSTQVRMHAIADDGTLPRITRTPTGAGANWVRVI